MQGLAMQGPAGNTSRGLPDGPPSTVVPGAGRCESGALMHSFGIFLQGLLGVVAFSTLMLKRFREPKHERRPWRIWFLDTSKQAIGMLFIHFANVYLADLTEEDPCSLYLINFLLDATVGMLLIYVGVRAVSVLVEWQQWEALRFGEYGDPLQCGAWVGQCALYIVIMIFEKSVVFIVLLILQWKKVALLNPIENPDLKLAIVMLIVPFFVNALMFWVVDNFLMRKGKTKAKLEERGANQDSRNGSKVRYRRAASHEESESEILISADDEMEESDTEEDLRRLPPLKPVKKKKHRFGLPTWRPQPRVHVRRLPRTSGGSGASQQPHTFAPLAAGHWPSCSQAPIGGAGNFPLAGAAALQGTEEFPMLPARNGKFFLLPCKSSSDLCFQ